MASEVECLRDTSGGKDAEGESDQLQEPVSSIVPSHVRGSSGEGTGYEATELPREESSEYPSRAPPLDASRQGCSEQGGSGPEDEPGLGRVGAGLPSGEAGLLSEVEMMAARTPAALMADTTPPASLVPAEASATPTYPSDSHVAPPPSLQSVPLEEEFSLDLMEAPDCRGGDGEGGERESVEAWGGGGGGEELGDGEEEEFPVCTGRHSPFFVVTKDGLRPAMESPGLLYARGEESRHNRDLLQPVDEVAQDVLELSHSATPPPRSVAAEPARGGAEGERRLRASLGESEPDGVQEKGAALPLPPSGPSQLSLTAQQRLAAPVDPRALHELESHALTVAEELGHLVDTLRNSLHAMSICAVQSVDLHKEALDNLHLTVDTNVKTTYTFLAKLEELHNSLGPLTHISAQVQEISESLKVLERAFNKKQP